jgi:diaminopropionate ammonia-lyase
MEQKAHYFCNQPDRPKVRLDQKFNAVFKAADPISFHRTLRKYAPTSLHNLSKMARSLEIKELWLKDESKRFSLNTFKCLGASYAIQQYLGGKKEDVVFCTGTDGNHGRSVAWAARKFKKKTIVFVPEFTAKARIKNIKRYKGKVIVVDGDYNLAVQRAREEAEKHNYVLFQDTSWEGYTKIPTLITAGYKTMLSEIDDFFDRPSSPVFDFVFLQAGVGTLASSVVAWFRNRYPRKMPKFVLVEPCEADSFMESAKNKKMCNTKKSQQTIMAGLNCGTPSVVAWNILRDGVDLFLSIHDDYAIKAMQNLYYPFKNDPQVFSGESGAAGLAGLIALACDPGLRDIKEEVGLNKHSRVLVFSTEGVTDPDNFDDIINREVELY